MSKAGREKAIKRLDRRKRLKKSRLKTQLNIAAFDQANLCGVSFELKGTNEPKVELWDLSIGTKESQGMKWIRFESRLKEFLKEKQIEVLAYELPSGKHTNPIIHSSKLICVIEKTCVELGIHYAEYSSKSIKYFACENGNANKKLMVEAAKELWSYDGDDDNEADALHILHYLKSEIN